MDMRRLRRHRRTVLALALGASSAVTLTWGVAFAQEDPTPFRGHLRAAYLASSRRLPRDSRNGGACGDGHALRRDQPAYDDGR